MVWATAAGLDLLGRKGQEKEIVFSAVGSTGIGGDLAVVPDVSFPYSNKRAIVIEDVFIKLKTGPVGAAFIVDVNINGTSIFVDTQANRPTIADAGTEATSGAPDTTALAAGDDLTIDIDQVGVGTKGADLVIIVRGFLA